MPVASPTVYRAKYSDTRSVIIIFVGLQPTKRVYIRMLFPTLISSRTGSTHSRPLFSASPPPLYYEGPPSTTSGRYA